MLDPEVAEVPCSSPILQLAYNPFPTVRPLECRGAVCSLPPGQPVSLPRRLCPARLWSECQWPVSEATPVCFELCLEVLGDVWGLWAVWACLELFRVL